MVVVEYKAISPRLQDALLIVQYTLQGVSGERQRHPREVPGLRGDQLCTGRWLRMNLHSALSGERYLLYPNFLLLVPRGSALRRWSWSMCTVRGGCMSLALLLATCYVLAAVSTSDSAELFGTRMFLGGTRTLEIRQEIKNWTNTTALPVRLAAPASKKMQNPSSLPTNSGWTSDPSWCANSYNKYFCTRSNWTWHADHKNYTDVCSLLISSGIYNLFLQGDSMMRHIFYAVLLLLSGSTNLSRAPWISAECMDESVAGLEGPFNEPVPQCRNLARGPQAVCNGKVIVSLQYDAFGKPESSALNRSHVIWGIGNHPLDGNYNNQTQALNAEVIDKVHFGQLCSYSEPLKRRLIWTPPHVSQGELWKGKIDHRVKQMLKSVGGFPLISARQRVFAEQTSQILAKCGIRSLIFTNLTLPLSNASTASKFGQVAGDGQHYGRVVNLLKARMLLRFMVAG